MPEPISLSSLAKQVTPKARIDALAAMLRSKRNRIMVVDGLAGSASAMLFTALPKGKSPYLIIANDLDEAGYIYHDLCQLTSESNGGAQPLAHRP